MPISYPWEESIDFPLPEPFVSIGMSLTDIVDDLNHDPFLSSGFARSDLEDGLDTHYIDPSFRDKLKKIVNFEVRFLFKQNCRVVIASPSNTVDNSFWVVSRYIWWL